MKLKFFEAGAGGCWLEERNLEAESKEEHAMVEAVGAGRHCRFCQAAGGGAYA